MPSSLPAADAPLCATAQNVSPAPWVMTAIFSDFRARSLRCTAADAAAGPPRTVAPAASRPPLTKTSRRVNPLSSSTISSSSCSLMCLLLFGLRLPDRCRFSELEAPPFSNSLRDVVHHTLHPVLALQSHCAPLAEGAVTGPREDECGECVLAGCCGRP